MKKERCVWCGEDPLYVAYHDQEWGVPVYDDKTLFEFLILEGMQAGLSWYTVLKKRDAFRQAFDRFDPKKIAKYDLKKVEALLNNAGIIRNKLKIQAAIENAKAFLEVKNEWQSFSNYIWHFVDGKSIQNPLKKGRMPPSKTAISDAMSKDLLKRGFKFVGSTICYAFMQAVGMTNDHLETCFRFKEIRKKQKKVIPPLVLKSSQFETKLGLMIAIADDKNLYLLEFLQRRALDREIQALRKKMKAVIVPGETNITKSIQLELTRYFMGEKVKFKTPIHMMGSEFQKNVWHELMNIPHGSTRSYLDISKSLKKPTAFRAVAQANATNQLAIIIPCHRVINTNGEMGGYAGGIDRKKWLLEHEK